MLATAWVLAVIVRSFRRPQPLRQRLKAGLIRFFQIGTIGFAVFLCTWGFGYRQTPVEVRWGFDQVTPQRDDADALTTALLPILSAPPKPAARDRERALASIRTAMQRIVEHHDGYSPAVPAHLKRLPPGTLMTFGVTGIASPFLLEANIDGGLPEVDQIGVGAHELAHAVGYCGEADADLLGVTACFDSGDRYAAYCGAMRALRWLLREVHPIRKMAILRSLPEATLTDLDAQSRAVKRHRSKSLSKVSNVIYDGYLKSQGVKRGRGDYARAAELWVSAWRAGVLQVPN